MKSFPLPWAQNGRPYDVVARSQVNVGEFRVLRAFSHLRREGKLASGTIFSRIARVDEAGNLLVQTKAPFLSRHSTVTVLQHPDHPITTSQANDVIKAVKEDIAGPSLD